MKNGNCHMCQSNEVYMSEAEDILVTGGHGGLSFSAVANQETGYFKFDTYVCLSCGYTAVFAHPSNLEGYIKGKLPELTFLQKAKGWKKVV